MAEKLAVDLVEIIPFEHFLSLRDASLNSRDSWPLSEGGVIELDETISE